jgi:hypothetical protein
MSPGDAPGPEQDPAERRWSWPAAALFIIACSALGWLLIVALFRVIAG